MSFNDDKKWLQAKRIVGVSNSWLEILKVYQELGGENVFVYTAGNNDKQLVVSLEDDDTVILLDRSDEIIKDSFDNVNKSKKIFSYSDNPKSKTYTFEGKPISVMVE